MFCSVTVGCLVVIILRTLSYQSVKPECIGGIKNCKYQRKYLAMIMHTFLNLYDLLIGGALRPRLPGKLFLEVHGPDVTCSKS